MAWFIGLDKVELDPLPDVIVSLELFSIGTWQAAALARRVGVPHIVHVAETMEDNPLYRLPPYRTITDRVGLRADGYICISERARQHAVALGCPPDRCHVVHLGVDTNLFSPNPSGLTREPIVTYVGQFRSDRGADKGVVDICDAAEQLSQTIPGLRVRLIGDGHLRGRLVQRTRAEAHLSVSEPVRRSDIPDVLRQSRVLAVASKKAWKWEEQFGFVLVEAMACGLPVAATRSGAIPEIVPEWNPLVAEGDVGRLAEAMAAALGPDGDEWGARNLVWARDNFNLEKQAEWLGNVLSELVP